VGTVSTNGLRPTDRPKMVPVGARPGKGRRPVELPIGTLSHRAARIRAVRPVKAMECRQSARGRNLEHCAVIVVAGATVVGCPMEVPV
jgi:hypothetical protein